jgi:hypothetical protein
VELILSSNCSDNAIGSSSGDAGSSSSHGDSSTIEGGGSVDQAFSRKRGLRRTIKRAQQRLHQEEEQEQ